MSRSQLPTVREQELLQGSFRDVQVGGGGYMETAQSALTIILKLLMQSDKCHLDFFLALPHNLWDLSSLISD